MPKNNSGQSLLEFLLVFSLGAVSLSASFYVSGLALTKLIVDQYLYQSLVCQLQSRSNCEKELSEHLIGLPLVRVNSKYFETSFDRKEYKTIEGNIVWQYANLKPWIISNPIIKTKNRVQEKIIRDFH